MPSLSPEEIQLRAAALAELQQRCQLCPRCCGAERDRLAGRCQQPRQAVLAIACPHLGEEPPLSGSLGAGTVFVGGCSMRCCFCQNHQISQTPPRASWLRTEEQLAAAFLELQRIGCHNLEWVSPTQHLPPLLGALARARAQGLELPLVYNTNGYDRLEVLRLLEGVVDIYLPDAKYSRDHLAARLSDTPDYVSINRDALREMWRQRGPLELDQWGLARRGVIVRHLVLPGEPRNTREVLGWLASELSAEVTVSLMAQYHPAHLVIGQRGPLGRALSRREYQAAVAMLLETGLENGWVQERSSSAWLLPDFDRDDPFAARPPSGPPLPRRGS